jgi:hypothetical protein
LREFHGVKFKGEKMNSAKILIAKVDGYELGVEHGKTMAEVDAYYEGLLKEIKELEEMLNERTPVESTTLSPASRGIPRGRGNKNGQKSREEINSRG